MLDYVEATNLPRGAHVILLESRATGAFVPEDDLNFAVMTVIDSAYVTEDADVCARLVYGARTPREIAAFLAGPAREIGGHRLPWDSYGTRWRLYHSEKEMFAESAAEARR